MQLLMMHFVKSWVLVVLVIVDSNLAWPDWYINWSKPHKNEIKAANLTFTFDRFASSASVGEMISYLSELNTFVLRLTDPTLVTTPPKATLFSSEHLTGTKVIIYNPNGDPDVLCRNIRQDLAGGVKSINTHNTCVRLHTEEHCRGKNFMYTPYTYNHNDLGSFGGLVKSIGPCHFNHFDTYI